MNRTKDLVLEYKQKKDVIKRRLKEFKEIYKKKDREIFEELCFCLLTPQSKAIFCDKAVKELKRTGLLFKGSRKDLRDKLKRIRFLNNKANYIKEARKFFKNKKGLNIKERLNLDDIFKTRDWLVRNVKGLGYKEASHFLRNIGLGKDLAILDIHVLRNLKRHGVIKVIPSTISKKKYLDIEEKMRRFSKRIRIPLGELDLLFWSKETGLIFK